MAARKSAIDLLSREDFTQSTLGRFLFWVLTVGRYIVIFTELVVITGFIVRIVLDRNLNAINEDLLKQKAIIASYRPTELKIRRVSQQMETLNRIEQEGRDMANLMEVVRTNAPRDMRLSNLAIDNESMDISATVLSPAGFSTFLANLQSNPLIGDLVLETVESGSAQDPGIHFRLIAKFADSVSKKATPVAPVQKEETF